MVIYTTKFWRDLDEIVGFIELDSRWQAEKFADSVEAACAGLDFMPYKFRKSLKFDDENVRDFVFKGYVLPYRVETLGNGTNVYVLGIYKENAWEKG